MAAGVHQIGHGARRQDRLSFHQHQMKSHAQAGHGLGAGHGVAGSAAGHHQAGGGKNASAMARSTASLTSIAGTEIVGSDNEIFQRCWPSPFDKLRVRAKSQSSS